MEANCLMDAVNYISVPRPLKNPSIKLFEWVFFFFFPGWVFTRLFHSLSISSLSFISHHILACLTMEMVSMLCNLMVVEILVMQGKCNGNIRWRYNWLSFHAIGNILLPQFHFSRIKTPPSVWPHACKQNRKHFLLSNLTGLLISCNLILSFFVIFTNSPFKIMKKPAMGVLYINY